MIFAPGAASRKRLVASSIISLDIMVDFSIKQSDPWY
jgi:hypothetical protein